MQTIDDTGGISMVSYVSPSTSIITYSAEGGSFGAIFKDKDVGASWRL